MTLFVPRFAGSPLVFQEASYSEIELEAEAVGELARYALNASNSQFTISQGIGEPHLQRPVMGYLAFHGLLQQSQLASLFERFCSTYFSPTYKMGHLIVNDKELFHQKGTQWTSNVSIVETLRKVLLHTPFCRRNAALSVKYFHIVKEGDGITVSCFSQEPPQYLRCIVSGRLMLQPCRPFSPDSDCYFELSFLQETARNTYSFITPYFVFPTTLRGSPLFDFGVERKGRCTIEFLKARLQSAALNFDPRLAGQAQNWLEANPPICRVTFTPKSWRVH